VADENAANIEDQCGEKRSHVMNLPIKSNLFAVAHDDGKEASLQQSLRRTLVASIGPACSAALRKLAVRVDIEPKPPKGLLSTRSTRHCPTQVDWTTPNVGPKCFIDLDILHRSEVPGGKVARPRFQTVLGTLSIIINLQRNDT
jgi:hypothetical protein